MEATGSLFEGAVVFNKYNKNLSQIQERGRSVTDLPYPQSSQILDLQLCLLSPCKIPKNSTQTTMNHMNIWKVGESQAVKGDERMEGRRMHHKRVEDLRICYGLQRF